MHTIPTTTSSFPLNIVNLSLPTRYRSLSVILRRKSLKDMTLNLKRLAMTKITSICSSHFRQSTAVQMWSEFLNQSLPSSSSRDFLHSRKNSGVENFGVMASTWPPSASGVIGRQSNVMWQTKERRWKSRTSSIYSLRSGLETYLVGSAPR